MQRCATAAFARARDLRALEPGSRLLIMVPMAPIREDNDTLAAVNERFLRGG